MRHFSDLLLQPHLPLRIPVPARGMKLRLRCREELGPTLGKLTPFDPTHSADNVCSSINANSAPVVNETSQRNGREGRRALGDMHPSIIKYLCVCTLHLARIFLKQFQTGNDERDWGGGELAVKAILLGMNMGISIGAPYHRKG